MADYKVVDAEQLDADLKVVADAIREKGGTSEQLEFPNGMADAVRNLVSALGLNNVTVLSGELVITSKEYCMEFTHNIGEVKPFLFIAECKKSSCSEAHNYDIYKVVACVQSVQPKVLTCMDGDFTLNPKSITKMSLFEGYAVGDVKYDVIFVDEPTNLQNNYQIRMSPNWFNFGMYRGIVSGEPYKYVLIYGDGINDLLS